RVREEEGVDGSARRRELPVTPRPAPAGQSTLPPTPAKREKKPKGPSKNRVTAQHKAERAVEQAEAALAALEQELIDPAAWATRYEAAKSEARHTAAKRAVDAAYAHLETLID
ncbi:MAG TPA: ABC transporter ATP-binding protein, partial [Solirubrobacteraceae bacterium]